MLKELLGDLYTPEIEAKLQGKKLILDDETRIPKSRLDQVIKQKNELEEQLKQHQVDLEQLKKDHSDNEQLNKTILELQEKNELLAKERQETEFNLKKDFALTEKLIDLGVKDPEARNTLKSKLNDVQFEDGKLIGFDDRFKPIQENPIYKSFFNAEKMVGQEHKTGEEQTNDKYFTKDQVEAMDHKTKVANIEKILESQQQWTE